MEKTPRRDRNRGDQTLIMINTPGKPAADLNASEKLNNSSPSTPSNTTKRSLVCFMFCNFYFILFLDGK